MFRNTCLSNIDTLHASFNSYWEFVNQILPIRSKKFVKIDEMPEPITPKASLQTKMQFQRI